MSPYVKGTWTDFSTVIDKSHMDNIENGIAALDTGKLTLPYGTTLPGSPVDGQVAILVDSTTNPTYQWTFRYNVGSSSVYKWEFVGGADAYAEVLVSEGATTVGSWLDLATVGPRVVVPRAGDYDATAGTEVSHSAATGYQIVGIAKGATTPSGAIGRVITSAAGYPVMQAASARLTAMNASDDVRLRYNPQTGGTTTWHYRWIRVRPVRVS